MMRRISVWAVSLLAVAATIAVNSTAMATESNPNVVKELVGKIRYTVAQTGEYRGEEDWRLTIHPDGSRTIRMTNPIKATKIFRDVVLQVDKNYRPVQAYISHWEGGIQRGSGFYWTEGSHMNSLVKAPNGILRQQGPFSWHVAHYDRAKGGVQKLTAFTMDRVGTSVGSILGQVRPIDVELLDEPKLTVGAGTFDTLHFRIEKDLELWVDKKEFITVLLISTEVGAALKYELVSLREKTLGD